MRIKILFATLLGLTAAFLGSCNDSNDDSRPTESVTQVTAPESVTLPRLGGRETFVVESDGEWELSTEADWLTVTPLRGYLDGEVTVRAEASAEPWGREASLTFRASGRTAAVTKIVQPAEAAPRRIDEKGPANCYLTAPADKGRGFSTCAFDATRKGNSADRTEIVDARIVWQDCPNLLRGIGYDAATGLIGITVGDTAGNAVVAAVDAAGTIRWSWHIWVTDYDPETAVFASPANENGTVWHFMDRNLGALDARPGSIGAVGTLYQWGRKDPFAGIGSPAGDERPLYDGGGNRLPAPAETAERSGTMELAVSHPHIFYLIGYKTNDWTTPSDDDLWGGVSRRKTMWDPCPAGWRVPLCDERGASPYGFMTDGRAGWSESAHGYSYGDWWLPCTGTRVYESGALSADIGGPYGGMWIGTAGTANPDTEQFPALYGQYFFVIDSPLFFGTNKDARSQGMAVRCVKE